MVEIHRGFDSLTTFNKKHESETKKGRTIMKNISSYRAVDTLFGLSIKESTKQRKAIKKALVDKVPDIPTYKGVEHQQTKLQNELANYFNHRGVK